MRKLKKELIEKLRKGECIIDNTGNPDTELLILIMNEAFNEYYGLSGTNRYYGRSSNLNTWECDNQINSQCLIGWDNIIPLKDFEEKELTELPKKWCIKGGDNVETIKNWLSTRLYRKVIGAKTSYYHFPEISLGVSSHGSIKEGYTEISFEDFERLVLKKNNMGNRKIIGYKAPYDLFNGIVKKGTLYVLRPYTWMYCPENYKLQAACEIVKEIVETWEVVYEEELKLPKIHGYEGKYDSKNNLIIYGCKEIPVAAINYLKSCNEVLKNKTSSSIGHVVLDSIIITMDDIYKIEDFINGQSNS